jgi:hypothetical protein
MSVMSILPNRYWSVLVLDDGGLVFGAITFSPKSARAGAPGSL